MGLPSEFLIFIKYCKSLSFSEQPDYQFLKDLFKKKMLELKIPYDYMYDWTDFKKINKTVIEKRNLPLIFEDHQASFVPVQQVKRSIGPKGKTSIFQQHVQVVGENVVVKMKEMQENESEMHFIPHSHQTFSESEIDKNVTLQTDEEVIIIKE